MSSMMTAGGLGDDELAPDRARLVRQGGGYYAQRRLLGEPRALWLSQQHVDDLAVQFTTVVQGGKLPAAAGELERGRARLIGSEDGSFMMERRAQGTGGVRSLRRLTRQHVDDMAPMFAAMATQAPSAKTRRAGSK